jgi:hypothetical protein
MTTEIRAFLQQAAASCQSFTNVQRDLFDQPAGLDRFASAPIRENP